MNQVNQEWWGERALRDTEAERLARQQDRVDAEAFFADDMADRVQAGTLSKREALAEARRRGRKAAREEER